MSAISPPKDEVHFLYPPLDCEHYLPLPSCIDSNLCSSQESDIVVDDNDAAESLHNIGKIPVSPFHPTRSGYSECFPRDARKQLSATSSARTLVYPSAYPWISVFPIF